MKIFIKTAVSATIALAFISVSFAQVSAGGEPYSFSHNVRGEIQTVTMPEVDVESLLMEDEDAPKDEPFRFGYPNPVNYNLTNSGTWEDLPDGSRLWRLRIVSPGAQSINLIYDRFHLPPGGEFFVYNEDRTTVYGAFTEQNNKPHYEFATTPTPGDVTILEYVHPGGDLSDTEISITSVIHGYRNIFQLMERNFGDSGACNNNVNCPEGDPWQDEKRSVAMILLSSGFRICTGAMVNNVRQDLTPYFLTANHCLGGENTWIFMFNYESPSCNNVDGPTTYTVQGSTLIANNSPSDFALLELQETPPESYNIHYAGWSAVETPPQQPVCIHHPSGDIKKITFDYDVGISDGWTIDDGSHWRIADWEDGTTEPGSSGSPLFDSDHRIVGQLHGGQASCSNNVNDYYGKFSYSWNLGGSPSSRLRDWLDPDNTGTLVLDGIDAVDLPSPELSYSAGDLSVQVNMGVTASSTISVTNTGEEGSVLYYDLNSSPFENPGYGMDDFGHMWTDSDLDAGMDNDWIDITGMGQQIFFTHNDQAAPPVDLSFDFPFYGDLYSQCIINANGWVGFGEDNTGWENLSLPSSSAPSPAIFGFWDDLNPENSGNNNGSGQVYYHGDENRFVIWFNNVIHWPVNYDGTYDFQIVLYPDGAIDLNYNQMVGDINSGTIGIQGPNGADGLLVAYNSQYVHSGLTVKIKTNPEWLIVEPAPGFDGALQVGETAVHNILFDGGDLLPGIYDAAIILTSSAQQPVSLPVEMMVTESGLPGDMNQDEQINVQDIIICVNIIIGVYTPDSYQEWAGDLNGDGLINVLDVIAMINIIIG